MRGWRLWRGDKALGGFVLYTMVFTGPEEEGVRGWMDWVRCGNARCRSMIRYLWT